MTIEAPTKQGHAGWHAAAAREPAAAEMRLYFEGQYVDAINAGSIPDRKGPNATSHWRDAKLPQPDGD